MKTKRLIIVLSIIAVFVVIVVLSSTVFTLKKVEINFYDKNDQLIEDNNTLQYFNEQSIKTIIDSGEFKFGKNMFLLKKSSYYQKLETANPYIKVIDITSKFPNTLVVKVVEREEMFYCPCDNGKYAILDGELKVLNIVDSVDTFDYIKIDIGQTQLQAGQFYNTTDSQKILAQLKEKLFVSTLDTVGAISLIQEVKVKTDIMVDNPAGECLWLDIQTRPTKKDGTTLAGVLFSIENATSNLEDKVYRALVAYNTFLDGANAEHLIKTQTGIIKVYNNLEYVWCE